MNDVVTQVVEGKARVKLTVNDGPVFFLSYPLYREQPYQLGDKLDLAAFQAWLLQKQYPEALSKAVRFLATRARSRQEVEDKLSLLGYQGDVLELVLYKLEKEALVDDEAFARDWAQARSHRQLGKARILQELRQKGVARLVAERACEGLWEDGAEEENSPAVLLAGKLLKRHQSEPDAKKVMQKVLSAMIRRGFSYEEASGAAERVLRAGEDS